MSKQLLERLEKVKLQALFLTDALGFTGDMENIKKICKKNNIILIEDNCEALGTELPSGKAGNFGLAASFSFFVAHHMSTIEGGMVCTDNDQFAEMLKIVRANGWDRNLAKKEQSRLRKRFKIISEFDSKYTFYDLGFNLRPTEITGFLGLFQLQFLEENIIKREKNFLQFEKVVLKNSDLLPLQHEHIKRLSTFALPVICKTEKLKEKYKKRFLKAGIEIRPMIAGNIQSQPFYKKYVREVFDLPGTDFIHNNGFYCGNYPELTTENLKTISTCLT